MHVVLYCRDKANAIELRMANRPAHLEYAKTQQCIRMAGPVLGADGTTVIGSLFVLEVEDFAAAESFHQADPYTKAGLWQSVAIHPFRWLLPENKG